MCFLTFLNRTRKLLTWKPNTENMLYVVMGNESCDLDSAVSAITLAFLLKRCREGKDFLPVLNIPRVDFDVKTEVRYLFDQVGIKPEDHLTFRDELSQQLLDTCHFILVDHHVSPFANRVDEVFDHRPYNPDKDDLPAHCKRTIQLVGSCATLIAEQYFNSTTNENNKNSDIVNTLLHRTIVLDTVNFSEKANRTTDKDRCMVAKLEQCLPGTTERRDLIFNELVAARSDVSRLNAMQLLRKDMKVIQTDGPDHFKLALPGFPLPVQTFIKQPNAEAAVRELANELDCIAIVLMGMHVQKPENSIHRDIGIITTNDTTSAKQLCDQLKIALLTSEKPKFSLEPVNDVIFMSGLFYVQNNVTVTRKDVLPICKNALDTWAKQQ